jgi:hypothetical protein
MQNRSGIGSCAAEARDVILVMAMLLDPAGVLVLPPQRRGSSFL